MYHSELYNQLAYALEEKIIPELISLSQELEIEIIYISYNIYIAQGTLQYKSSGCFYTVTGPITQYRKNITQLYLIDSYDMLLEFSKNAVKCINDLQKRKLEILELINFQCSYKKQVLVEKIRN